MGETLVLVAEMINSTTAFVAWQPSTKRGITGYEVELNNNDSSFSTQVSSAVAELYLGLNPADLQQDYTVRVAILGPSQRGQFSPPAKLSLPLGLPVSVQPGLAEAEDTAWLLLLLGSLALLLLRRVCHVKLAAGRLVRSLDLLLVPVLECDEPSARQKPDPDRAE